MTLRLIVALGMVFTCFSGTRAQSSKGTARLTESALVDLENRWVAALVKGDTAALDKILVDSYVDTDEEAHRIDKQSVLAAFRSKELNMTAIKLSGLQVHPYGRFAVVTGTAEQTGTFRGSPLAPKIVFTDSFIRQNGEWRVVASQRTTAHSE